MDYLEQIIVDDKNEKYFTEDNNSVLISGNGIIIQYAINCDCEEFASGYYVKTYGTRINDLGEKEPIESYEMIYNIADYAFAGAKKLKK